MIFRGSNGSSSWVIIFRQFQNSKPNGFFRIHLYPVSIHFLFWPLEKSRQKNLHQIESFGFDRICDLFVGVLGSTWVILLRRRERRNVLATISFARGTSKRLLAKSFFLQIKSFSISPQMPASKAKAGLGFVFKGTFLGAFLGFGLLGGRKNLPSAACCFPRMSYSTPKLPRNFSLECKSLFVMDDFVPPKKGFYSKTPKTNKGKIVVSYLMVCFFCKTTTPNPPPKKNIRISYT